MHTYFYIERKEIKTIPKTTKCDSKTKSLWKAKQRRFGNMAFSKTDGWKETSQKKTNQGRAIEIGKQTRSPKTICPSRTLSFLHTGCHHNTNCNYFWY